MSDISSELVIEEEPKPVQFYPCACPHGCSNISTLPMMGLAILGRHARCEDCAKPEHINRFPAPEDATQRKNSLLTEVYVPTAEEKAVAEAARKEVADEIWLEQWTRWQASLPEKFRSAETSHKHVLTRLNRIAAGQPGIASMLVVGPPGVGKTYLAVAYANAVIREGYFKPTEVLYGSESELLAAAANSSFGEVEKELRKLISPKLKMLVVDDVGRGTWLNESMRAKVFSLVLDKFWSENKVVVFTSNLSTVDLGTYLGEGAMDRLRSLVGNESLVVDDESKRRKVTDDMLARTVTLDPENKNPPIPPRR